MIPSVDNSFWVPYYSLCTPHLWKNSSGSMVWLSIDISRLERCVKDIWAWMKLNLLNLNDDKTELLVITYRPSRDPTLDVSIKVGDQQISPSDDPPMNIGVVHYNDVIMEAIASQITSLTIVYSIVYSDADQRKHQSSASLVFVWRIHRGPVNSPHKWPVTRKMFLFDDVIMFWCNM